MVISSWLVHPGMVRGVAKFGSIGMVFRFENGSA